MSNKPTLVERLRHASKSSKDPYMHELHGRAADRIEELEKAHWELTSTKSVKSEIVL